MRSDVPEGWSNQPLIALADYHNGRAFKPEDWTAVGLPIIRISNMRSANADWNSYDGTDIDERDLVEDGDLLFSWSATLMTVLWNRGRAILNQHIFKVIEKPGVERVFIKYLLDHHIEELAGSSHGSTMKHIKRGALTKFKVPLPPLAEQRKIAAILTSVDEAIQATEAVIAQTRRVKEGLLQELLTRGIGHTRFKQTEIGEIPETWEVNRLVEVSDGGIRNGIFKKREEFGDGGVPMINVLDCFTGPPVRLNTLERVLADHGEIDRFEVANGDLLFIRSSLNVEGIGHSAIVKGLTERTVFECHVMRVRPVNEIVPDFLYHYTKSKSFRCRIMGNAQTTTMTTLPQDGLGSLQVPIPPVEEQRQIADTLNSLDLQVHEHENLLNGHRGVKTGLLQDLLTGTVRVTIGSADG